MTPSTHRSPTPISFAIFFCQQKLLAKRNSGIQPEERETKIIILFLWKDSALSHPPAAIAPSHLIYITVYTVLLLPSTHPRRTVVSERDHVRVTVLPVLSRESTLSLSLERERESTHVTQRLHVSPTIPTYSPVTYIRLVLTLLPQAGYYYGTAVLRTDYRLLLQVQ